MRTRLRSEWRNSQAGFLVLIEILIVVLIIAMLAAYFLTSGGGSSVGKGGGKGAINPEGEATSTPGAAMDRARDSVCRNNLSQLRNAISIQKSTTGEYPESLESLQAGVPLTCPVGEEPYEYDAETGQVTCPHPGHEGY